MNFAMKSMPVGMDLIMLSMDEAIHCATSVNRRKKEKSQTDENSQNARIKK